MPSPACRTGIRTWLSRASDLQARTRRDWRASATTCAQAIDDAVARLNGEPGRLETWRGLDALIQDQHWRAAHFRVAADDINYRRFFNINELAGLRMELPELFDHAHGWSSSCCATARWTACASTTSTDCWIRKAIWCGCASSAPRPFYLVVEKILARHETLREDWPVEGTTGYEFANLVLGLLIDPGRRGRRSPQSTPSSPASDRAFGEIVRDCKIRIMTNEMASELNVLARDAARVARQNPRTADFTRNILQRALREIVACFPVYRTYVDGDAARRPRPIGATSIGRWPRRGGTRPTSIPACSTSCTAC